GETIKPCMFCGGVDIAAVIITVLVMNGTGIFGTKGANSSPPAAGATAETTRTPGIIPTGTPGGPAATQTQANKSSNGSQSDVVDNALYSIKKKLDELDDKDTAGFRAGLRQVNALEPRTAGDTAYAELVRARALL